MGDAGERLAADGPNALRARRAQAPGRLLFTPRAAGAPGVGADGAALAVAQAAAARGTPIEIVRTGSRGLYWLEPMVELATAQGRIA
ncbi:hypothetical protein, partial [Staphylococcus aureus]|uniref:hypothetical protein n=1 Tax=Staphylococcus aureus TaxID=1280 RepID=UPI00190F295A